MNVEVRNISVIKNGKQILDNINLRIESGKIYGLLGNNGAGKTSFFRTLLGLIDYQGEIIFNDRVYKFKDKREYLTDIGVVFPLPEAYEEPSIEEIVAEYSVYMPNFSKEKFDSILRMLGLNISLEILVKELSLGMKQKLNIALALAYNPKILILDEVFNGLDRDGILAVKDLVRQLKNEGKIIIISSHSFGELENLIDNILIMNKGRIIKNESIESEMSSLEEYYNKVLKGEFYE